VFIILAIEVPRRTKKVTTADVPFSRYVYGKDWLAIFEDSCDRKSPDRSFAAGAQ
jgi:hypothetical protein